MHIPTDLQSITAAWLTEALRSDGVIDQSAVRSFEIDHMVEDAGYIGQLARLVLDYTRREENAPASLIIKLSSADPNVRTHFHESGLYEREVRIYKELATQAHLFAPRCYYGDINLETGESVLLLEDLTHLKRVRIADGCTLSEAELVIRHLAQLHAQWWNSPELPATGYLSSADQDVASAQEHFQGWWSRFPQQLLHLSPDAPVSPEFVDLGNAYGQKMVALHRKLAKAPFTLIHRDATVGNLLFGVDEGDPALIILDWQAAGYGRGASDVTYFMAYCLPLSLRRRAERSLLQTYHDLLLQNGVLGYEFDDCWTDYRRSIFRNINILALVVSMLDVDTPEKVRDVQAALSRVAAFSEDHDVGRFL